MTTAAIDWPEVERRLRLFRSGMQQYMRVEMDALPGSVQWQRHDPAIALQEDSLRALAKMCGRLGKVDPAALLRVGGGFLVAGDADRDRAWEQVGIIEGYCADAIGEDPFWPMIVALEQTSRLLELSVLGAQGGESPLLADLLRNVRAAAARVLAAMRLLIRLSALAPDSPSAQVLADRPANTIETLLALAPTMQIDPPAETDQPVALAEIVLATIEALLDWLPEQVREIESPAKDAEPSGAQGDSGQPTKAASRDGVAAWLLALRKAGEPFTTYRNLAERFGKRMDSTCSANTIRKAIESDKALAGWAARGRQQGRRSAPAAVSLAAPDALADPAGSIDGSLPDEVDAAFRRLLARVAPEQRAELERMTDEGKRLAAESEIEQEAEAGLKRRNYKRA